VHCEVLEAEVHAARSTELRHARSDDAAWSRPVEAGGTPSVVSTRNLFAFADAMLCFDSPRSTVASCGPELAA